MATTSKTTTNHDTIRKWAESRGGHPPTVKRTAGSRQEAGILRIDFPDYSGEQSLKPISWDQFFEKFDDKGLVFLYENRTGQPPAGRADSTSLSTKRAWPEKNPAGSQVLCRQKKEEQVI
jgi:hypothetical protein